MAQLGSSSAVTVALSRARATAGYCMQTRPVDFGSKYPPPCNATNPRYLAEPKITKASWTRFGRYCARVCVRGVSKMRNFVQPRRGLSTSRSPTCYFSSGRGLSLSVCTVPSNTYLRRPSLRQGNKPRHKRHRSLPVLSVRCVESSVYLSCTLHALVEENTLRVVSPPEDPPVLSSQEKLSDLRGITGTAVPCSLSGLLFRVIMIDSGSRAAGVV